MEGHTHEIQTDYFCASIIVDDYSNRVTKAAPIVKYFIGQHIKDVIYQCRRKGWVIREIYKQT